MIRTETSDALGSTIKCITKGKSSAVVHNFDRLIFHYFLQLIFRLTPLTSSLKSNEKLVNQKLCNTAGQPRQRRFGPCLDFGFQYALIRNNRSKIFGLEY